MAMNFGINQLFGYTMQGIRENDISNLLFYANALRKGTEDEFTKYYFTYIQR